MPKIKRAKPTYKVPNGSAEDHLRAYKALRKPIQLVMFEQQAIKEQLKCPNFTIQNA